MSNQSVYDDEKIKVINSRSSAMVAMILAAFALSFSGLIIRNIEDANPWQINIYRNLAFIAVIGIIFSVRFKGRLHAQISQIRFPVLWAALGLAVTGIAIIQAFTHTLVANTVFIMSAVPFITMVLAYVFLNEKISSRTVLTMCIAAIGLIIMISDGIGSGSAYGNIMALIAAIGFSIFAVIARANRHMEMLPALFLAAVIIAVSSIYPTLDDLSISMHDLLLCFLWGAALSGISHWIFIIAARYLAAAELTLFDLLETALAPIWVWIFIGETVGFWVIIGGLMVIGSVGIKNVFELSKRQ